MIFRVLQFLGDVRKELSKEKATGYSQSKFGLSGIKMKKNVFDGRLIEVHSNENVEVKISNSKKNSKKGDIFHVVNAEIPNDLPQGLNNNESDLNVVAISYQKINFLSVSRKVLLSVRFLNYILFLITRKLLKTTIYLNPVEI